MAYLSDSEHLAESSKRRSMSIYQFLIAVRQQDGQQLMTETGETTRYRSSSSHGKPILTIKVISKACSQGHYV